MRTVSEVYARCSQSCRGENNGDPQPFRHDFNGTQKCTYTNTNITKLQNFAISQVSSHTSISKSHEIKSVKQQNHKAGNGSSCRLWTVNAKSW